MKGVARVIAGYAAASVATGLPWPLLLVLVWEQYGDGPHAAWAIGLAGAARMAPYVLLSWALGSLGDHVRRDLLVRVTLLLRILFLAACGLAVSTDHVALAVVAAGLAVTAGTPTYPAIAASLPALAGPARARATELIVTVEVGAWVVGPALGGLLLATRGWTLLVAVALSVVALGLLAGVPLPSPEERATDAVAGMLREVSGSRAAVRALALAWLLNLLLTSTGILLLPLTQDVWETGERGFGLVTACLGFGALGAPLLSRLFRATWVRGLAVLATLLLLVALTPLPWVGPAPARPGRCHHRRGREPDDRDPAGVGP